ncbi:MAG: FecR domain-containing protein [Planctomycetota bacterium]
MNRPTRAEAIEAWSDGSLTPAQRQVLDRAWQEDPAGVRAELRLVLLLRQTAPDRAERSWRALEQALAGTGSGDALARAVDARLHPRSRILLWAGLAAAAVLALIIGGAWYMHRLAPAPPAGPMTIVGIIGPARLDGVELTVTPAVWPAGATLQCAPGTTVRIEGSDGVALELLSATARRHPRTGDDLVLLDGLMHALVKPRTHASALRLHTPHARAEVLGTAFTLRSGETASALRVHRGTVAFSAATGDAATLVAHREAATIGADGSLSRRSLPLLDPRLPRH